MGMSLLPFARLLPRGGSAPPKPNIILLVTDDMRRDEWAYMPHVQAKLAAKGCWLPNFIIPTPLCAPSRMSMLTGLYAEAHGVLTNHGAYEASKAWEAAMLPAHLQAAGFRTGLFGKYLNGVLDGDTYVPAGWTRWYCTGEQSYYGYTANSDGTAIPFGRAASDYQPLVAAAAALDWIDAQLAIGAPFFAMVTPYAPHAGAKSEAQYAGLFPELDGLARDRARALQTVDQFVKDLYATLGQHSAAGKTYVIATSDNGYLLGEHGLTGKRHPYEESVTVGAFVRGPGIAPGSVVADQLANIDLAPTILHLAGAAIPARDGLVAAALLGQASVPRQTLPLSAYSGVASTPLFTGWRSNTWKYIRWADGAEEEYNLVLDPLEQGA